MRSSVVSSVIWWVNPHFTKGDDWSQDVYAIAHNDVFISQMQFDQIKLHLHDKHVHDKHVHYKQVHT